MTNRTFLKMLSSQKQRLPSLWEGEIYANIPEVYEKKTTQINFCLQRKKNTATEEKEENTAKNINCTYRLWAKVCFHTAHTHFFSIE